MPAIVGGQARRQGSVGRVGLAAIWESRCDPVEYAEYVAVAHRWAVECGRHADEIESALFYLGPGII